VEFNPNSTFLYIVAVIVILFVLVQSVYFLVRAYRRGKKIGMSPATLKKTVLSTAIFTVAPAVSILMGVVVLAKALGIPLPWIRLSVIGALTYELPAAEAASKAFGIELNKLITDPKVYSAIAWVMTLGILPSIILPPILMKGIRGGMVKIKNKDAKWSEIFMTSLFLGMISAFLGVVFADIGNEELKGLMGWIPLFVLLVSAAVMAICGLLIKKCKMGWLENYAIAISMLCGMAFSAFITPVIAG